VISKKNLCEVCYFIFNFVCLLSKADHYNYREFSITARNGPQVIDYYNYAKIKRLAFLLEEKETIL
jgi:hypothetical protein